MPELPDVERLRRTIARVATGREIERVLVTDSGILRNVDAQELDRVLRGRRFEEPERRGKWVVAWTDGPAMLLHFGMTGEVLWAPEDAGRHPHDRVIVVLDRGELRYRNMRKLGGVWLATGPADVDRLLDRVGADALDMKRASFLRLLGTRRGQVKATLLNQSLIAGIGNLVADEALWRARIHPARRVGDLSPDERSALHRELRTVIRGELNRDPRAAGTRWTTARGRPGALCPRCRTSLGKTVVGGRTTYFCPSCQRPPGDA